MKELLSLSNLFRHLFVYILLTISPICIHAQDCSGKIQAAKASKEAGNYRKALAQFTAAASTCGDSRRTEIEKDILDIYDRIEKLKDDALIAQQAAKKEADRATNSEKKAELALENANKANNRAQAAYDSLKIVLESLGKANEDKVRLILGDVERDRREGRFEEAVDEIKTAKILRALPDSVKQSYVLLSKDLLNYAMRDLDSLDYWGALYKIKFADELGSLPTDDAYQILRGFLLENIRQKIDQANYVEAENMSLAASKTYMEAGVLKDYFFEIAFCYYIMFKFDDANRLLAHIVETYGINELQSLLHGFKDKTPEKKKSTLIQAFQQLDLLLYEKFQLRYFPPLSGPIPEGHAYFTSDYSGKSKDSCKINVKSFLIGPREVTFYEYGLFCSATGKLQPADNNWGKGNHPVINVSWQDALEYCNWRSLQEMLQPVYYYNNKGSIVNRQLDAYDPSANGYRLPTEFEWEFAAGNGEKQTKYSWGNELTADKVAANLCDETAKIQFPDWQIFADITDGFIYTAPTGHFKPNDFGLYDMTGNVWEWCWDTYKEDYCNTNNKKEQYKNAGMEKVLRGGSWGSAPTDCLVRSRHHSKPDTRNFSTGFRLAKNIN